MNNNLTVEKQLRFLGLSGDEVKVYLELLKEQRSHLELARATGINRTKIYRIAEDLQKRSLITKQTDDRGTFLVATDPTTLEVDLTSKEETLKNQRDVLDNLLPQLNAIQKTAGSVPGLFEVNTYEGLEGMKQMLWHELKATGEVLIFGSGSIESLLGSKRLSERHRTMTVAAGYTIREIINPDEKDENFTKVEEFKEIFNKRLIPRSMLNLTHQIVVYNNTVATYHWREGQKVGVEIVNEPFANMWRQVFEMYWQSLDPNVIDTE